MAVGSGVYNAVWYFSVWDAVCLNCVVGIPMRSVRCGTAHPASGTGLPTIARPWS